MDLETALDKLYELPLDEFTTARNELAAELKAAGRAEDATTLKKIKKPPLSAWALNQVARREPDDVGAYLDTLDSLEGASSSSELRAATEARKSAAARIHRAAGRVLADGGHPASGAVMQKIMASLVATPSEEEVELLRKGHLASDIAGGLDDIFGAVTFASDAEMADEDRVRATERAETLDRAAGDAERTAHERAVELDAARSALERAERLAEEAWAKAEAARGAADAAKDAL